VSDRLCSINGCERPLSARGWCSAHYWRWRTSGDPGPAQTRRYRTEGCSVDGCQAPHFVKGMCKPHYRAVEKHGTPTPRRRGQVAGRLRICATCKRDMPAGRFAGSYCHECNTARASAARVPVATTPAACDVCGALFDANGQRRFACSAACTRTRNYRENSKHVLVRRARTRGAEAEAIRPRDIFERDSWTCGICDEPVDRAKKAPHPRSPSIDHVIPLSRGGQHTYANVQTAHLGCNVRKGARLIEKAG
jgi:5-methylcytosine-specific restriction endonuclease McrA